MAVNTKFDDIYEVMKERIRRQEPGSRVLSVREAKDEFRVASGTVCRGMERLYREGLIVKRVGKGTYVADGSEKLGAHRNYSIVLALPDYPSPNYDAYARLFAEVGQNAGCRTRIVRYDWRETVIRSVPRERFDGLIIVPSAGKVDIADLYRVRRQNIPFVILDRLLTDLEIDFVCSDDELGAAMAAEHLVKLGHRRLAMLLSEPRVDEARERGFVRQAQLLRAENVSRIDCRTASGESSFRKAYETLMVQVDRKGLDFTGVFVLSDASALGAIKAFHDLNIKVPEAVSVVGFDGISEGEFYHPSLTTIGIDNEEKIHEAMKIIYRRLSGERNGALHHLVRPELIVRESTGRVANC